MSADLVTSKVPVEAKTPKSPQTAQEIKQAALEAKKTVINFDPSIFSQNEFKKYFAEQKLFRFGAEHVETATPSEKIISYLWVAACVSKLALWGDEINAEEKLKPFGDLREFFRRPLTYAFSDEVSEIVKRRDNPDSTVSGIAKEKLRQFGGLEGLLRRPFQEAKVAEDVQNVIFNLIDQTKNAAFQQGIVGVLFPVFEEAQLIQEEDSFTTKSLDWSILSVDSQKQTYAFRIRQIFKDGTEFYLDFTFNRNDNSIRLENVFATVDKVKVTAKSIDILTPLVPGGIPQGCTEFTISTPEIVQARQWITSIEKKVEQKNTSEEKAEQTALLELAAASTELLDRNFTKYTPIPQRLNNGERFRQALAAVKAIKQHSDLTQPFLEKLSNKHQEFLQAKTPQLVEVKESKEQKAQDPEQLKAEARKKNKIILNFDPTLFSRDDFKKHCEKVNKQNKDQKLLSYIEQLANYSDPVLGAMRYKAIQNGSCQTELGDENLHREIFPFIVPAKYQSIRARTADIERLPFPITEFPVGLEIEKRVQYLRTFGIKDENDQNFIFAMFDQAIGCSREPLLSLWYYLDSTQCCKDLISKYYESDASKRKETLAITSFDPKSKIVRFRYRVFAKTGDILVASDIVLNLNDKSVRYENTFITLDKEDFAGNNFNELNQFALESSREYKSEFTFSTPKITKTRLWLDGLKAKAAEVDEKKYPYEKAALLELIDATQALIDAVPSLFTPNDYNPVKRFDEALDAVEEFYAPELPNYIVEIRRAGFEHIKQQLEARSLEKAQKQVVSPPTPKVLQEATIIYRLVQWFEEHYVTGYVFATFGILAGIAILTAAAIFSPLLAPYLVNDVWSWAKLGNYAYAAFSGGVILGVGGIAEGIRLADMLNPHKFWCDYCKRPDSYPRLVAGIGFALGAVLITGALIFFPSLTPKAIPSVITFSGPAVTGLVESGITLMLLSVVGWRKNTVVQREMSQAVAVDAEKPSLGSAAAPKDSGKPTLRTFPSAVIVPGPTSPKGVPSHQPKVAFQETA